MGNRCDTEGVDARVDRDTEAFGAAVMALDLASMEEGIIEAIEAIRPALQSDGGDIVFVGVDEDGVVEVSLVGACGTCPVSMMTLKAGVERIIMDRVPGVTEVVASE
jgi:Fe-S cluster biogenesis protein NfuA